MKKTAVIPGSFDPITLGHVELVKRAAQVFDRVILLVCINFDKTYLFTHDERAQIAKAAVSGIDNVSVEIYDGWLWEYLISKPDCVLVKGVRCEEDFIYEKKMADFNLEKSGVHTLLFFARDDQETLSSTKVRSMIECGGEWKEFIPQNAQKIVEKFYAEK